MELNELIFLGACSILSGAKARYGTLETKDHPWAVEEAKKVWAEVVKQKI